MTQVLFVCVKAAVPQSCEVLQTLLIRKDVGEPGRSITPPGSSQQDRLVPPPTRIANGPYQAYQ